MTPLAITATAVVSALGRGSAATLEALRKSRSGLRQNDLPDATLPTYIGRVEGLEDAAVAPELGRYDCRNNRLAQLALEQDGFVAAIAGARLRYGPQRIGVFLGTTSSGILEVENAYRHRDAQTGALPSGLRFAETFNLYSASAYVREALNLEGPAVVVSAACASSAKAFASASRAIAAGLCDAAIVGGVETLCLTTMHGFASLGLLSDRPCRPCDRDRSGISLAEGAGFALLEKGDRGPRSLAFLGYGESADAYHMSTPHPEGRGAALAMRAALSMAAVTPEDIDYVNLHGTGTPSNDVAEDAAVCSVLGPSVPRSSTKGATGHALGAAGILEAIITLLCIANDFLPGTINTTEIDPAIRGRVLLDCSTARVKRALSNSLGFGGSNCSLVFGESG
jgi:3-oxoacyl-[acyl-carrier-protein] synthase-1